MFLAGCAGRASWDSVSVLRFLGMVAEQRTLFTSIGARPDAGTGASDAVSVSPSDHVGTVCQLLAASASHRVFIVDSSGAPVGIVTTGDILRYVLKTGSRTAAAATP